MYNDRQRKEVNGFLKKQNNDRLIANLMMIAVGAFCGIFVVLSADAEKIFGGTPRDFILHLFTCVLCIFAAYFIQAVIHEAGHLIFGLLSGYEFVSFRIGNVMFIKERGELRIKLYNIVGTGGQCLMKPPRWENGIPYRLYNFGGCILNLISALVLLPIFIGLDSGILKIFVGMLTAVGFGNVFINGIPLQIGGISNDGRNALLLGKSEKSLRAFWLQLYVNGLISEGERMRNMPENWFFLPEGEESSDPVICTVGVMLYNYYFDCHDFEKAEETAEYMLKTTGLLGLHRNELLCELLFLRIFRGASSEEIDSLNTPALDKYIRSTANYVSRRRLAYAYQLLYRRNITLARKCRELFDRTVKSYPYSSEIENEKEIIELIDKKSEIY